LPEGARLPREFCLCQWGGAGHTQVNPGVPGSLRGWAPRDPRGVHDQEPCAAPVNRQQELPLVGILPELSSRLSVCSCPPGIACYRHVLAAKVAETRAPLRLSAATGKGRRRGKNVPVLVMGALVIGSRVCIPPVCSSALAAGITCCRYPQAFPAEWLAGVSFPYVEDLVTTPLQPLPGFFGVAYI
jgi:hypothetical protein